MNKLPKLFINIGDFEICLIAGYSDEQNSFRLLEKLILPINDLSKKKNLDLNIISEIIKKNILTIEQKVNYIFKDVIVILNNGCQGIISFDVMPSSPAKKFHSKPLASCSSLSL